MANQVWNGITEASVIVGNYSPSFSFVGQKREIIKIFLWCTLTHKHTWLEIVIFEEIYLKTSYSDWLDASSVSVNYITYSTSHNYTCHSTFQLFTVRKKGVLAFNYIY